MPLLKIYHFDLQQTRGEHKMKIEQKLSKQDIEMLYNINQTNLLFGIYDKHIRDKFDEMISTWLGEKTSEEGTK